MKKSILIIALAISIVSCNTKTKEVAAVKTAYVDTSKLLEEYTEAKDIEAKYKTKSDEMGKELENEVARFKYEASNFQKNAQLNGQAWAQQKGAELQKREQQLSYAQQALVRQLQEESGTEMDTLVKNVKKFIKEYGKEKGYDYIYGTGDAVSILYAQDKYDITKEIVKLLNDKYKSIAKVEAEKETTEKKDTVSFVRIQLKNSIDSTDLVVRFSKNASPVYDKELDAYKFSKNAGDINIWSTIDDIDYSINAIPFPESKVDVALGIKVVKGGTYKLCSNELKRLDNYSITLRDLSTNTSIDLKKGEIFTFEAPAGITENRFILSIANQTTDIPVITTNKRKFHIYASYGSLNILSLSDEYGNLPCSVTVYELTGRKIFQVNNLEWNGNGDLKQFAVDPAENGLLIVEVRAGNKKYVEKIKFNR